MYHPMNKHIDLMASQLFQKYFLKYNFIAAICIHIYSYFSFIHVSPNFLFIPIIVISLLSVAAIVHSGEAMIEFERFDPKYFLPLIYLMPYTIFVFLSSTIGAPEGVNRASSEGVELIDGLYYLTNRQEIVREITKSEYWSYLYGGVRGFTGHLMLFAYLAYVGKYGAKST